MGEFWGRCWSLFKTTAMGEVEKFSPEMIMQLEAEWLMLDEQTRAEVHADLKASSDNRRGSMAENAKKSATLLGVLGFIAALVAIIAPGAHGVVAMLTATGPITFVIGTGFTIWMNSPKFKLLRRKRNRVPEALRKLQVASFDVYLREQGWDEYVGFEAYCRSAYVREKRDILTFVERRLLLFVSILFIVGIYAGLSAYLLH